MPSGHVKVVEDRRHPRTGTSARRWARGHARGRTALGWQGHGGRALPSALGTDCRLVSPSSTQYYTGSRQGLAHPIAPLGTEPEEPS